MLSCEKCWFLLAQAMLFKEKEIILTSVGAVVIWLLMRAVTSWIIWGANWVFPVLLLLFLFLNKGSEPE